MMESPVVKYYYFKLSWVLCGKLINKHLEGLAVAVRKFKQAMGTGNERECSKQIKSIKAMKKWGHGFNPFSCDHPSKYS